MNILFFILIAAVIAGVIWPLSLNLERNPRAWIATIAGVIGFLIGWPLLAANFPWASVGYTGAISIWWFFFAFSLLFIGGLVALLVRATRQPIPQAIAAVFAVAVIVGVAVLLYQGKPEGRVDRAGLSEERPIYASA
jgi:hypothetical protein